MITIRRDKESAVNGESDHESVSGELEYSLTEECDVVPGRRKIERNENYGVNEANAAAENNNSRYLFESSDEVRCEKVQFEEAEIKDQAINPGIKEEENCCKRKMKITPGRKETKQKLTKGEKEEKRCERNLPEIIREKKVSEEKSSINTSAILHRFLALFLLLYVRLLTPATKGKAIVLIFLISGPSLMVASSPTQHLTSEPTIGFEYKILDTSRCGKIGFLKPNQCERNEKLFQILIDFCGLTGKCDPGFKPTCAQGDSDGVVHFCSPEKLTCKAGFRRKVRIKNKDIVIVKEEKCPNRRYQQFESDCYSACANSHGNMKELPDQYAVYYDGDHVSPPLIYCDYKKGFYSSQGTFLYRYDDEIRHKIFECTNVDEHNPCTDEMFPLPDGSCVSPCQPGYSRDVHDDFKCKKVLNVGLPMDTSKNTNKNDDDESETLQEKLEVNENEPEVITTTPSQNWHVTVVIVMVVFALLFTVSSIVIIYNT